MPYTGYDYEHVSIGADCIQAALDVLEDEDKQQVLSNLEN